ncbi:phosphatase family protein [Aspergillus affinis]|uniref:phosphatase family protein n=1 Tax=Aspergillus affinis TaxID=1070780 RepID=UPI0022FE6931|nr:phosphatase family protein [Aspergillus affinis]KAI9040606.1 phosphatase family protein [Aspergillus affinis]
MSSNADRPASQAQHPATPGDFPSDDDNREPSPDAPLDPSSLPRAIKARKSEYTRQRSIRIKVGTWNVAAIPGTEQDIGNWFTDRKGISEELSEVRASDPEPDSGRDGDEDTETMASSETQPNEIGLYVLGLQEIVDVSSPAEALRPYVDPAPANKWKAAVEKALPSGYQLVAETQLVGLLLLIYAAPSVVDSVSSVSCTNVGTGLLGYMGNKGGVAARLLLGETTSLVFVNCHLAAGADKGSLDRRNWDASQIVGRTKFDAIDSELTLRDEPTESIGKEDYAFWFGDLNYRLEDIPGDDVRQVLARHAEDENSKGQQSNTSSADPYEDADPHSDPASLQTTISSLLPHDQLRLQQAKEKAFHEGWREGDISFLPTYKYDVGSVARFDSSEKQRGPSWCDRILYRSQQDRERYQRLVAETADSRKRDDEMKARGLDTAAADDNVLFDYDPDVDGADDAEDYDPTKDQTSDGASFESQTDSEDPLRLEYYASHQRILSSDHKPLAAGFTLTFESVIPHLKAKVHQEVVRELDRAENESRPGLTVVVDRHGVESAEDGDPNAVNFGDIPFDVPVRRSLTVANTSGVPAKFTLEKPEGSDVWMVPWLEYQVEMPHRDDSEEGKYVAAGQECILHPGELANVELTAYVRDIELARALNDGKTQLEEILVLRVVSGRDHFISAYGKWLPTCFGRSLADLTLMPEAGARTMSPAGMSAAERGKQNKDVPLSAPRELFRLTEAISELTERAVAEWSMTRDDSDEDTPPWLREPHGAGWPFAPETWTMKDKDERLPLLASAREALDTSQPFNDVFAAEVSSLHRLEILSETLIVFLGSLQDGIVTKSVWQDLDQQILTREKSKAFPLTWEESQAWVLESLAYSPAHSVSFTFVTFMLARIANEVAPATSIPSRDSPNKPTEEESKPNTQASDNNTQPVTPTSPSAASFISGGSLRRRTRTFTTSSTTETKIHPLALRRQTVETMLSGIFSSLLISSDIPVPTKDKERRALDDRKRSIVEPFLKAMGIDNKGPSGGVPA